MIALDANILIYAAKYHAKLPTVADKARGSAVLLGQRRQRAFGAPESAAGEALLGARSEAEQGFIAQYLRRMSILEATQVRMVGAMRLIRAYPERNPRKFRYDAMAYAIGARAGAMAFCTYDKGFIGAKNRDKLRERCAAIHLRFIPAYSAQELLAMPHINPPPKPDKDPEDSVAAHRRRAIRRVIAAVGHDPLDQMRYLVGVSRSFGLKATR